VGLVVVGLDDLASSGRLLRGISDDGGVSDIGMGNAKRGILVKHQLNEVLDFGLVGIRIAVRERPRDRIMKNTILIRQNECGARFVVGLNHALGAKNLNTLIVAVRSITAQINSRDSARRPLELNNHSIEVIHILNLLNESVGRREDLNRLSSHQPAVNINIVRSTIVVDSARGLQEGKVGKWVIAGGSLNYMGLADLTVGDGSLELHKRGIKSSLEAAQKRDTLGLGKSVAFINLLD
jgi:hypothetical protein